MSEVFREEDEKTWKFMYSQIKDVITDIGPRAPCSLEEKEASIFYKNNLEKLCDKVEIEEFECYPRMFNGWPRLSVCFTLFSFLIFLLNATNKISQLAISTLSLLIIIFLFYCIWMQFFNYGEFVNKFLPYKKKTSQNVVGTFNPTNEIKQRIIFAAHYDSSFRFNLIHFFDVGYAYFIIGGVVNLLILTILYILGIIGSFSNLNIEILLITITWLEILSSILFAIIILVFGKWKRFFFGALAHPSSKTILMIGLITLYSILMNILMFNWIFNPLTLVKISILILINAIPFLVSLFFFLGGNAVPGAIDNLSAVGACMGVPYLLNNWRKSNPEKYPKNTEIVILLTGSEEAGNRGSENFGYKHAEYYNKIPTYVFNLESLSDASLQKIITKEATTRTICDPKIYNLIAESAKELGINYEFTVIPSIAGGTDCGGFYKGGLRVSGLEGINYRRYLHWYHTDGDDLTFFSENSPSKENIRKFGNGLNVKKAITDALKISMRFMEKIDIEN